MKQTMKKALGLILVAAMLLAMGITAFAEEKGPVGENETTDKYKSIHVTKELKFPERVLPAATTFKFAVSVGKHYAYGTETASTDVTVPTISVNDLTFTSGMGTASGGIVTAHMQSTNLLEGLLGKNAFPKAGIYVYTITETADTVTLADGTKESLTYNTEGQSYTLRIYVSLDENGDTIVDGGTVEDKDGNKVNPSPQPTEPGGEPGSATGEVVSNNGFNFKNVYTKEAGSIDPEDPDTGLHISKTIAGSGADKTKEFGFTILIKDDASTNSKTFTLVTPDGNITITPGTESAVFYLTNEEAAQLKGIQVGATVTVTEAAADPYTASYEYIKNGTKGSAVTATDKKTALSTGEQQLGEARNEAAYTNTLDPVTPTGIIINNLPYILLVAIALGGVAMYFVSRRRSYSEE